MRKKRRQTKDVLGRERRKGNREVMIREAESEQGRHCTMDAERRERIQVGGGKGGRIHHVKSCRNVKENEV